MLIDISRPRNYFEQTSHPETVKEINLTSLNIPRME